MRADPRRAAPGWRGESDQKWPRLRGRCWWRRNTEPYGSVYEAPSWLVNLAFPLGGERRAIWSIQVGVLVSPWEPRERFIISPLGEFVKRTMKQFLELGRRFQMNRNQTERLQWIALTALGIVAGLALALPLGVPIFAVMGAMAGTPIVLGIVGLSLGTAQWPVIRRHISSSAWWVTGSTVGMAVGLTLGVILVEQIGRALAGRPVNFRMLGVPGRAASFGMIGLIGGAGVGLAQWLVLQRQAAKCGRWVHVNALSLGVGLACGSLLADAFMLRAGSLASGAVLLVVGSGVAGASTARVLATVFRSQPQQVSAARR
jgi:hypothetical protein